MQSIKGPLDDLIEELFRIPILLVMMQICGNTIAAFHCSQWTLITKIVPILFFFMKSSSRDWPLWFDEYVCVWILNILIHRAIYSFTQLLITIIDESIIIHYGHYDDEIYHHHTQKTHTIDTGPILARL